MQKLHTDASYLCLFCNFSKHHSGFVCIDLSLITGARKAFAMIELLAEETIAVKEKITL